MENKNGRFEFKAGENLPGRAPLVNGVAYFKDNQLHRYDGPAIEYANGTKEWLVDGKLHRENGPAVEKANGMKQWFLEGVSYSEENYKATIEAKQRQAIKDNFPPEKFSQFGSLDNVKINIKACRENMNKTSKVGEILGTFFPKKIK
ncbi:hypothetical protein [Burkholderia cepacia]|uniref:hypothetical protein n=1 Tax=Burkholderia cepacia TaxID=292 RepID=UPI001CF1439D|nr:hypothetical protein [Burkholderia cepacia]MCA8354198.1 hypothetical protein [Burkholderia cepacia]